MDGMGKPLTDFDDALFAGLVEKVTVHSAEQVTFRLAGGIELMETMRMMG